MKVVGATERRVVADGMEEGVVFVLAVAVPPGGGPPPAPS